MAVKQIVGHKNNFDGNNSDNNYDIKNENEKNADNGDGDDDDADADGDGGNENNKYIFDMTVLTASTTAE